LYYDSNKNNEKFFHTENFTPTDTVPNPLIELVNQLIEIKFEQKDLIERIEKKAIDDAYIDRLDLKV
jgi:hypothetical protein